MLNRISGSAVSFRPTVVSDNVVGQAAQTAAANIPPVATIMRARGALTQRRVAAQEPHSVPDAAAVKGSARVCARVCSGSCGNVF